LGGDFDYPWPVRVSHENALQRDGTASLQRQVLAPVEQDAHDAAADDSHPQYPDAYDRLPARLALFLFQRFLLATCSCILTDVVRTQRVQSDSRIGPQQKPLEAFWHSRG
jgi:hypothetical protein